ncbi:MAG TPA: shikimate kinase [Acidobacteriota bacterium]|nr:shikimate kinase [Acidobacteriota bacterium]
MKEAGHLFLVGFMGCGKSTVGSLLARRLDRPFYDLDQRIVEGAGRSIEQIFEEDGEKAFRALESQALKDVAAHPPAVVALGGGAFCRACNRKVVQSSGVSLWLQVPFQEMQRRIEKEGGRPLAGDARRLQRLYRSRLPHYRQADLSVQTRGLTPSQVARAVLKALDQFDGC